MIGIKSLLAVLLAAAALALGAWRGVFDAEHFVHLSAGSAFAIGLFASACAALVGYGWRPGSRSRTAIAFRRAPSRNEARASFAGLAIVDNAVRPRELPALAQRAALVLVFATIALGTLGNEATARIASVPGDLAKPSRAEYCHPEAPPEPDAEPEPEALPPPVDQAGCALVKRAYALGYAKTLGSCAPKTITIAPVKKTAAKPVEVCTRRQLDEPFLHYAARKLVDTTSDAAPVDALAARIHDVRTRLDYARDLLADIRHAVTGTPHASHHLWIDLPDPHPRTLAQRFTGHPPCATHYADLPLWPAWDPSTPPSTVFEHVLGQLLFATRFGTTASCSDFTIHWSSAADACTRLVADPAGYLADSDALASIHAVLDRRARQLAMRDLASALGAPATLPEPPPARAVTSLSCLMFDGPRPAVTKTIVVEGETLVVREVHAAPIAPTGSGPVAVYQAVALVLAGSRYAGAASGTVIDGPLAIDDTAAIGADGNAGLDGDAGPDGPSNAGAGPSGGDATVARPDGGTGPDGPGTAGAPGDAAAARPDGGAPSDGSLAANGSADRRRASTGSAPLAASAPRIQIADPDFPLLALEPLVDADPFLGNAALLDRADLVAVFPFEQHLRAFVDAFRRVYLPQRGRL